MTSHGSFSTYTNHACRCADCRQANADWQYRARRRRAARGIPEDKHGTLQGYNEYRCRCEPCKAAKSVSNRGQRQRRREAAQ